MEYLVVDTELRFALAYYCSSELTFPRNLATSIFSVLLLMNISILELSWGGGWASVCNSPHFHVCRYPTTILHISRNQSCKSKLN